MKEEKMEDNEHEWFPISSAPLNEIVELGRFPSVPGTHVPNIAMQTHKDGFKLGNPEATHWRRPPEETLAVIRETSTRSVAEPT
jgi:hypothetical protein